MQWSQLTWYIYKGFLKCSGVNWLDKTHLVLSLWNKVCACVFFFFLFEVDLSSIGTWSSTPVCLWDKVVIVLSAVKIVIVLSLLVSRKQTQPYRNWDSDSDRVIFVSFCCVLHSNDFQRDIIFFLFFLSRSRLYNINWSQVLDHVKILLKIEQ
jgi:hypothetical protein